MELTALYLIIYIICAYNVSFWLVYSEGPFEIFDKFRNFVAKVSPQLRKALDCMNCTPTWVGLIASILNILILPAIPLTPFGILLHGQVWWGIIIALDAIFTSGAVYLTNTLQEFLESFTNE
jgi:hypothetical protein